MKRVILVVIMMISSAKGYCQLTTYNDNWYNYSSIHQDVRLSKVNVLEDRVEATIELRAQCDLSKMTAPNTNAAALYDADTGDFLGYVEGRYRNGVIDKGWSWYYSDVKKGEIRKYTLVFQTHLTSRVKHISIKDRNQGGVQTINFTSYNINVSRKNYLPFNSEKDIEHHISQNYGYASGIYEHNGDMYEKLACVKYNGEYYIVWVDAKDFNGEEKYWELGDIKAKLRLTPSGVFTADWYDKYHTKIEHRCIKYDGRYMWVYNNSDMNNVYRKYLQVY